MTDFDRMMASVMDVENQDDIALKLEFDEQDYEDQAAISSVDKSMEAQALKNVRDRRKRLQ
jgi:hypothetical protein